MRDSACHVFVGQVHWSCVTSIQCRDAAASQYVAAFAEVTMKVILLQWYSRVDKNIRESPYPTSNSSPQRICRNWPASSFLQRLKNHALSLCSNHCTPAKSLVHKISQDHTRSKGDKKRWEERPHGDPRVLGLCSMSVCIYIYMNDYICILFICRHIAILCKMHMMYIDKKWHEYYAIMCSIRIHVSPDCWLTSVQWASPAPRPRCGVHRVWQPFGWRPRKS